MSDHARQNDKIIFRLEQKIEDFMKQYEKDALDTREWQRGQSTIAETRHKENDIRLRVLEDFMGDLKTSWVIGRWIFTITGIGAGGIWGLFKFFWSHRP